MVFALPVVGQSARVAPTAYRPALRVERAAPRMVRVSLTDRCDMACTYCRTKDGAEVDFALSENDALTHLIECKHADNSLHKPLQRFATQFAATEAVQLVAELRQEENRDRVSIRRAGDWLATLDA